MTAFKDILESFLPPQSNDAPSAPTLTACGVTFLDGDANTPTEPDTYSTEFDPMSDDSTLADNDMDHMDALLQLCSRDPQLLEDDSDTSWDSQLTQNEDPISSCSHVDGPLLQDPVWDAHHSSESQTFFDDVEAKLQCCLDHPWYKNDFFWDAPSRCSECLVAATRFIVAQMQTYSQLKIGITENPWARWNRIDCGYGHAGEFSHMFLLYAAPTSKSKINAWDDDVARKLKVESTGAFEKELIKEMHRLLGDACLNRKGAGGECPSNGYPHFAYVVFG